MYAYLIVEIDKAKLFVDTSKVGPEVMDHLENAGIELRPYDSILSEVERWVCDLNLFEQWAFFRKSDDLVHVITSTASIAVTGQCFRLWLLAYNSREIQVFFFLS